MDAAALTVVAAAVFVWSVVSGRLERADLTAPIVFTAIGGVLAGVHLVHGAAGPEQLKPLVELTLVWVLFSDAARVRAHDLRGDLGAVLRLLGVGLPLTVLAGWGLAAWLLPGLGLWAAPGRRGAGAHRRGAGDPRGDEHRGAVRSGRLITVESGLDDGIATPIVLLAIGGMSAAPVEAGQGGAGPLVELAIGVGVGSGIGFAGGRLLRLARSHGWAAEELIGIAVLALALLADVAALAAHGNGFIAAFCGGIAFGAAAGPRGSTELAFIEQSSAAASSLVVWLAFGAIAVPIVLERLSWTLPLYAALSLTVVRMLPVAVALLGTRPPRRTVLFIGWFGPRGLASLVFALLALEDIGSGADEAVAVIGATVLLSVLAHGVTAAPLAARYGHAAARQGMPEAVPDLPVRACRAAGRVDPAGEVGDEAAGAAATVGA